MTDDVRNRLISEHMIGDETGAKKKLGLTALLLRLDHTRTLDQYYDPAEKELGTGGQGSVSVRRKKDTGKNFAVKLVDKSQLRKEPEALRKELEVLILLDHPHIVRFHEWFEDKLEGVYLVMELCHGGTLEKYLSTDPMPSLDQMRLRFKELTQAVSYCHGRGVVHRDLKLENVLLTKNKTVKLCDFGLSDIRETGMTGEWMEEQCGTAMYLAPEVIHSLPVFQQEKGIGVGTKKSSRKSQAQPLKYDEKCDIWSMGIMLFAMLAAHYKGRTVHPFQPLADEIRRYGFDLALWRRVLKQEPHWELVKAGSEEEANLLYSLLRKNPKNRISAQQALDSPWLLKRHVDDQHPGTDSIPVLPVAISGSMQHMPTFAQLSHFEKAVLTVVAHYAHEHEMSELKEVFHSLDKDRTGFLTQEELKRGLVKCGVQLEDQEFADLFKALDADGTGKIAYTEWLAATIGKELVESEAAIDDAFQFFDLGGTGTIEMWELEEVLGSDEAKAVFAEADTSGDGHIDREEFGVFMAKLAETRFKHQTRRRSIIELEKIESTISAISEFSKEVSSNYA